MSDVRMQGESLAAYKGRTGIDASQKPYTGQPSTSPASAPASTQTPSGSGKGFSVSTSGTGVMDIVGAGSGLAVAAYLVAVALNGNATALGALLMKEEPYLEFVVAVLIIWALHKYGPTGTVTDLITVGVIVGVVLRLAGVINLNNVLTPFAQGKAGILQTLQSVLGQVGQAKITQATG